MYGGITVAGSDSAADNRASQRGAWLGITTYVVLTIAKVGGGLWSGSTALVADGVNNLTDIIGNVAVLCGLKVAGRPADAEHRYGHGRAEAIASLVVAVVMGLVGLDVAVSAARAIFQPDLTAPHIVSLWVGLASALVMWLVYRYNLALSRRTRSKALEAAAFDNRSDAFTSLGAAAGIVGSQLGWRWLDPLAGCVVAIIIMRTAYQIGSEAAHSLMDGFETDKIERIAHRVAQVEGVLAVHAVRARHVGNEVAVEVTIGVSPSLSVVEAHRVADRVEESLQGFMDIEHVHVHAEPSAPLPESVTG